MRRFRKYHWTVLSIPVLLLVLVSFANGNAYQLQAGNSETPTLDFPALSEQLYIPSTSLSGRTIDVGSAVEVHIIATGSPTAITTIRLNGGTLIFENPRSNENYLNEELLSQLRIEAMSGNIHFRHADLNRESDLPTVPENVHMFLENSRVVTRDNGILLDGGALTAINVSFEGESAAIRGGGTGSSMEFYNCVFTSASPTALDLSSTNLTVDESIFITNGTGIKFSGSGQMNVTRTIFQGNNTAVRIDEGCSAQVSIHDCAFFGNWEYDIANYSQLMVNAARNFWSNGTGMFHGDVDDSDSQFSTPLEPEVFGDGEVVLLPIPPLADGDEPLLAWDGIEFTASGIPVQPTYYIYRSSEPYFEPTPDNRIGSTQETRWQDNLPIPDDRAFYRITTLLEK